MKADAFHLLPAVWDERHELHGIVWPQLRRTLEAGDELNHSERRLLAKLLERIELRPKARRALGFKAKRTRKDKVGVEARNAAIADDYVAMMARGLPRAKAEVDLTAKYGVSPRLLKKITDSARTLSVARGRLLARRLSERAAAGKPFQFAEAGDHKAFAAAVKKLLATRPPKQK